MISITAKIAVASDEDEYLQVAFGEAEDGEGHYVLMQLAKEPDDQDRRLGLDGLYLEIDGQEQAGYGVVEQIEIAGSTVRIDLKSSALGLPPDSTPLEIACSIEADEFSEISTMLQKMGAISGTPVTTL